MFGALVAGPEVWPPPNPYAMQFICEHHLLLILFYDSGYELTFQVASRALVWLDLVDASDELAESGQLPAWREQGTHGLDVHLLREQHLV